MRVCKLYVQEDNVKGKYIEECVYLCVCLIAMYVSDSETCLGDWCVFPFTEGVNDLYALSFLFSTLSVNLTFKQSFNLSSVSLCAKRKSGCVLIKLTWMLYYMWSYMQINPDIRHVINTSAVKKHLYIAFLRIFTKKISWWLII